MFSPGVDQGPPTLERRNPTASGGRGPRLVAEPREDGITIDLRSDDAAITAKLIAVTRLRDPHLADHAQRTAEIAVAIAEELGLGRSELDHVYLGAQLHDIGKLGVTEAILWKPSGLTTAEWRAVRTHPEEGHRLIADVVHRDVGAAVLYHHERMDGDGYPFGVDGRTLSIVVRVVQVADAFDAITSDRPYQRALPTPTAVGEISRCAGSQFDPEVAAALERVFDGHEGRFPPIDRPGIVIGDDEAEEPVNEAPADPFGQLIDLRDRRV